MMQLADYASYDALGLAELISRREVTPRELGRCVLSAIEAVNPRLNAVIDIYHDVVAGLGVTGGEHLAGQGGLEDPAQRGVARLLQLDGDPDPVRVHGHGQRGGGGVAGEPPLARRQLGQVEAPAPQVGGHGGGQVAHLTQLGEVLADR